MRILVAGDFRFSFYEPDFCDGLRAAGAEVRELKVAPFFGPGQLLWRAQDKLLFGPGVLLANAALIAECARFRPDAVLAWRACWLSPLAIRAARMAGARKIALYNNDDPFGPDRDLRRWKKFRKTIPAADVCFAYRRVNLDEYRAAGARRVHLLRSWFRPGMERAPVLDAAARERFGCDLIFIGHCEDDGRVEQLDALMKSGLSVKLFGTGWNERARGRAWEEQNVVPLYDADYARAIAAAKVALVFLSRRNRDLYTRRCFEIPAVGTAMLAPRTTELRELFEEDREAAFFADSAELLAKAQALIADDRARMKLAAAGHARVLRDGHDVASRARVFLDELCLG